jgi:hypothetical protein
VRAYLIVAPLWVQAAVTGVLSGLFFGTVMGLWDRLHHPVQYSWGDAITTGILLGVLYAVFTGLGTAWRLRRERPDLSELRALTRRDRKTALRASTRGPVPEHPAIRQAALHQASRVLAKTNDQQVTTIAVFGLLIVASVLMTIFTLWSFAATALFASLLSHAVGQPRRLDRRVTLLHNNPQQ